MKKKSRVLLLAFAMIFTFMFGACGGGADNTTSADSSAAAYDKILEEIKASAADAEETLTVATSPDFAPMEFVDTSRSGDNKYVGFDILLANDIANSLGKRLVIKPMSFDAVQSAVKIGKADLGISGFSWTEEREDNYLLTRWYKAGENEKAQTIITTKENDGKLKTADSYKGLKVGAQGGSLQKILVEEQLPDAELVLYDNLNDACAELVMGKIDALAVAAGNGDSFISESPDKLAKTGFIFEVDDLYKNNVIIINSENTELCEQVNAVLDQEEKDNVWDKWYEACQMLSNIKTIDELGYDDEGNKITE